jgi:hypothetical protein
VVYILPVMPQNIINLVSNLALSVTLFYLFFEMIAHVRKWRSKLQGQ